MPVKDALGEIQASVTKSATFTGASLDMKDSMRLTGMGVSIDISAIEDDTGDESYTFELEESADDVTFNTLYVFPVILSVAPGDLLTQTLYKKVVSRQFIRLKVTIAGTVVTGVTYSSFLTPDVPNTK